MSPYHAPALHLRSIPAYSSPFPEVFNPDWRLMKRRATFVILLGALVAGVTVPRETRSATTTRPTLPGRQITPVPANVTVLPDGLLPIVKQLADPAWGGRGIGTAGIDSAADYIAHLMGA